MRFDATSYIIACPSSLSLRVMRMMVGQRSTVNRAFLDSHLRLMIMIHTLRRVENRPTRPRTAAQTRVIARNGLRVAAPAIMSSKLLTGNAITMNRDSQREIDLCQKLTLPPFMPDTNLRYQQHCDGHNSGHAGLDRL
jgi:hypothetical protein